MKNKDRYDLRELRIIIDRSCNINYCSLKIIHKRKKIFERIGIDDYEIFNEISGWLEQDYSPLDEKEKEYLSSVIKPWRYRVKSIVKQERLLAELIIIKCEDGWEVELPNFEMGAMYQGMELNKEYRLGELGI